jgi:hypothetical protein
MCRSTWIAVSIACCSSERPTASWRAVRAMLTTMNEPRAMNGIVTRRKSVRTLVSRWYRSLAMATSRPAESAVQWIR